jgi:diguanylate cyclase (GGDEF)-like protein
MSGTGYRLRVLSYVRRWLYLGNTETPAGRALLIEQFRILTSQIPVLYGVLIVDSVSIAYVLPPTLPVWFRFGVPGALILISAIRMIYWIKLRSVVPTAEAALRHLAKTRILASALNAAFSVWALSLFENVDPETRAPLALLVFMGSVGSAYCLGSFPSAAQLTLLLSALPISLRLLFSGDALHVCIGINLCMLMVLLIRMMNTNYSDLVNLVASRAMLLAEGERARNAETAALSEQAKAREIAGRFDTALNNMSQGLCFFDGEQRLIVSNRRYVDMYGLPPESVKPGTHLREIVDLRFAAGSFPAMSRDEYLVWRTGLTASQEPNDSIVELTNGRVFRICHRPMPDRGWVATHEDITEQYRAEKALSEAKSNAEYLAWHDALTDLPNRAALEGHFSRALDDARERGGSFAVLCIDLDRFKQINDLFGHSMGDAALRLASQRLQLAAEGAFVARVGGDEFVAMTEQQPLPSSAELLANRLRGALDGNLEIDGHSFDLDLSIGIAVYPRDGEDARSLLANADAALYRAKHDGRGAIRFFTAAMDQQLRERRALERDLKAAVANGELFLEYQPQRHRNGEVIGFEALVRWHHPQRGIVPPAEFIPIAEESDLIIEIGEWVLREACREAATWSDGLQVAVNVSTIQFRRGDLQQLVATVLRESGISPARLELEITEGVLVENVARAAQLLKGLKTLGICIALDDFGTGYSSLSYLQSFPLDRIKIDRSFIASLGRTERSLAIVRAVIGLAHGLGLPALAEGVETADQLATLVDEGCDELQGFLIGRPHPIAAYAHIVHRVDHIVGARREVLPARG